MATTPPAAPATRTPRRAAARPSAPGTISGSVPFVVEVEPISVRVTAQVAGAGQPAAQPAPAAAPQQGMPLWARIALGVLAGTVFVTLLFILKGTNSNSSATSVATTTSGQSEVAAPVAEQRRSVGELAARPAPAACTGAPNIVLENNINNCTASTPAAPSTRRNPVPGAPTAPAVAAPAVPTVGIPPHGCMYTSDGTAILKGQTAALAKGTVIARSTFADINASTDKAIVAIRNQFPNWKTDLPQRMQMCSKWSEHQADLLQEPKDRALGETTYIK